MIKHHRELRVLNRERESRGQEGIQEDLRFEEGVEEGCIRQRMGIGD